jgi:hypothetical protein
MFLPDSRNSQALSSTTSDVPLNGKRLRQVHAKSEMRARHFSHPLSGSAFDHTAVVVPPGFFLETTTERFPAIAAISCAGNHDSLGGLTAYSPCSGTILLSSSAEASDD